jgi:GTPase
MNAVQRVTLADLLIHVVDISHPQYRDQMLAVEETVAELGADGKQTVIVFNKIDRVADREIVTSQLRHHPGSVALSARTGEGMDTFFQELEVRLGSWRMRVEFRIPSSESALLAEVHRVGHVLNLTYEGDAALVTAHVPPELKSKLAPYEKDGDPHA